MTTYVVVEFPGEVMRSDGQPSGNRRGWLAADNPLLLAALAQAREIARTDDAAEAQRLIAEGACLVAREWFDAVARLEIVGQEPARVLPAVMAHLMACMPCRATYEARLVEILSEGDEGRQGDAETRRRGDALTC